MEQYLYIGNSKRVFLYPRAFEVSPGDVIDAPENPDLNWFVPVEFERPEPTRAEEQGE